MNEIVAVWPLNAGWFPNVTSMSGASLWHSGVIAPMVNVPGSVVDVLVVVEPGTVVLVVLVELDVVVVVPGTVVLVVLVVGGAVVDVVVDVVDVVDVDVVDVDVVEVDVVVTGVHRRAGWRSPGCPR